MPSFDLVSEINNHELQNAVDQTQREITNRFDFKGAEAKIVLTDSTLTLDAKVEFQITQIHDILYQKMAKRGLDITCLDMGALEESNQRAKQTIQVKQGIETETAKKIIKAIKTLKIKVQTQIQGEQIRISGKKKDDLQQVMQYIKDEKMDLPLQFINFRD